MNVGSSLPVVSIASVKRVLERPGQPTVAQKFWSFEKGRMVDQKTGGPIDNDPSKLSTQKEYEESLLVPIIDIANEIHRKSLKGPAEFVILPEKGPLVNMFSNMAYFKTQRGFPDIKPAREFNKKEFADAESLGICLNRFKVYKSNSLPQDQILVGRFGDGIIYSTMPIIPTDVPQIPNIQIDFATENDTLYYKGEVTFWGFLKVLNLPEENKQTGIK